MVIKRMIISILLLICIISISVGQSNSYGISLGIGKGQIIKALVHDDSSYDLNTGISFGIQYSRKLMHKLHLMAGFNWYKGSLVSTPPFYPGRDLTPIKYDIQLIYIAVFTYRNSFS